MYGEPPPEGGGGEPPAPAAPAPSLAGGGRGPAPAAAALSGASDGRRAEPAAGGSAQPSTAPHPSQNDWSGPACVPHSAQVRARGRGGSAS